MAFLTNKLSDMLQDYGTGRPSFGKYFAVPFMVVSLGLGIASGVQHIRKGEEVIDLVLSLAGVGITLSGVSKGLSIAGGKYSINSSATNAVPEGKNDEVAG